MTTQCITPRIARLAAILLLGLLWLGSSIGCRKTESKDSGRVEIPHPDVTNLDKSVQKQLQDQQLALAALCDRPGASEAQLSQSYGEMGMLYHAYQLYEAAEACYRNAQALSPQTFRWPYYLANLHGIQGDPDGAVAAFEQALAIKADDVPALINLAQTHLAANRPDEAKPFFKRALVEDPACAAGYLGLGKIAAIQREHKLAVKHFKTALDLQPDATAIHYVLAMAYRKLKEKDKAAEHLKKCSYSKIGVSAPLRISDPLMAAIVALPIGMQHHKTAAVVAFKAGKINVALKELREVVRANPDDPLARLNLGVVLARSGDPDGAIEQYRKAIRLRPKFARAHRDLAAMLANKGAYDEAQRHFLEAVTCDPQLFDAHSGLARLAVVTGKHQLAVTHYALAVKIDPRHVAAREGHVIALTKAGRYADALDSLEKSRKILPRSMTLTHAAARFLATCPEETLRDGPKALKLAKVVFRTYQCIEHAETLAMAFAETGNYERAKKWQNDAIEAAKTERRGDVVPRLKRNLALYESGKPCRTPW